MSTMVACRIVQSVYGSPSRDAVTATYIGPPRRIYVIEPLENPIPARPAPRTPKEPVDPGRKRVREPKVPAP
jgi:hypothetical protein